MTWPFLRVLREAITKQADKRVKMLEEEVKLERDMRVTQANIRTSWATEQASEQL